MPLSSNHKILNRIKKEFNSHTIDITLKDNYLDVRVNGKLTLEENFQVWVDIVAASEEFNCYNILGISNLEKFTTMYSYNHTGIFESVGVTLKHRIAWVELNKNNQEMIRLVETVLKNRAQVNGGLFENIEAAKDWLLNE